MKLKPGEGQTQTNPDQMRQPMNEKTGTKKARENQNQNYSPGTKRARESPPERNIQVIDYSQMNMLPIVEEQAQGRELSDLNPDEREMAYAWYRKNGILNKKERAEAGGSDADNGEWAQGCHVSEILTTEEAVRTLGKNHPAVNAMLKKDATQSQEPVTCDISRTWGPNATATRCNRADCTVCFPGQTKRKKKEEVKEEALIEASDGFARGAKGELEDPDENLEHLIK